jgi:DNA-binding NtrC family response regulator
MPTRKQRGKVVQDGLKRVLLVFAGTVQNERGKGWQPGLALALEGAKVDDDVYRPADVYVFHQANDPKAEKIAVELVADIAKARSGKGHPPVSIKCADPLRFADLRAPVREAVAVIARHSGKPSDKPQDGRPVEFLISTSSGHPAQIAALLDAVDDLPVAVSLALLQAKDAEAHRYVKLRGDDADCLEKRVARFSQLPPEHVLLIQGPSGAGKSHLARALHAAWSKPKTELVEVNCGAFPDTLIESELFGHEVGAFSGATARHAGCFERADAGTLFLDEIGELPLDHQVRLLKALEPHRDPKGSHWKVNPIGSREPRKVRARVILGTNRDVLQQCVDGAFRVDLYGRIAAHCIQLPALTELRHTMLPRLMEDFDHAMGDFARAAGVVVPAPRWQRDARQALVEFLVDRSAPWTWNHRDLQHLAQRLAFRVWVAYRAELKRLGEVKASTLDPQVRTSDVEAEATALRLRWAAVSPDQPDEDLRDALADGELEKLTRSERVQASAILRACRQARSKANAWALLVESGDVHATPVQKNPSTAMERQLSDFVWRKPLL